MAQFTNMMLTQQGAKLINGDLAGQKLTFTRCAVGDGYLPEGTALEQLEGLVSEEKTIPINSIAIKEAGHAVIRTTLTNKDLGEAFYIRELGLYAKDSDGKENLYAVGNAGDTADILPAYGDGEIVEVIYDIIAVVGSTIDVTAVIDDSIIYATALDLDDHRNDPAAHGNHIKNPLAHSNLLALHLWQSGKTYVVGDICYSPSAASYKRFECIAAGTSGAVEPNWPDVGRLITDNTVQWIVDDLRDGTPVGRSVYEHRATPRPGYIHKNGAVLNRAEFPRLWAYAQDSGLLVTDSQWLGGLTGCFSSGDESVTFRIPDGRGEFERGWDNSRGVDSTRVLGSAQAHEFKSHYHVILATCGSGADMDGCGGNIVGKERYPSITQSRGGTETRPRNIALLSCIKY